MEVDPRRVCFFPFFLFGLAFDKQVLCNTLNVY